MSALIDKGMVRNSPPLQGRGKGWGLPAEQLATLKARARDMRNNPAEPEIRLWRNLSNSQLAGFKFRRQKVIGRTIADFYCPAAKLVIEVDGDTHCDPSKDARRDAYLRQFGLNVLHVTNVEVIRNIDGVLQAISLALESSTLQRRGRSRAAAEGVGHASIAAPERADSPHPNPSPEGEGLNAVEAQKLLAISLEGSVG